MNHRFKNMPRSSPQLQTARFKKKKTGHKSVDFIDFICRSADVCGASALNSFCNQSVIKIRPTRKVTQQFVPNLRRIGLFRWHPTLCP